MRFVDRDDRRPNHPAHRWWRANHAEVLWFWRWEYWWVVLEIISAWKLKAHTACTTCIARLITWVSKPVRNKYKQQCFERRSWHAFFESFWELVMTCNPWVFFIVCYLREISVCCLPGLLTRVRIIGCGLHPNILNVSSSRRPRRPCRSCGVQGM